MSISIKLCEHLPKKQGRKQFFFRRQALREKSIFLEQTKTAIMSNFTKRYYAMSFTGFTKKSILQNLAFVFVLACLCITKSSQAQVSLISGTYTQDFNTLASSGSSSVVPTGWMFNESGSNANSTYTAGNGSSSTGDTYSFGATANSERAFGGLLSGSLTPLIGGWFQNNSGQTINSITINFTGEQWRLGTADANNDVLDFEYQVGVNNITAGGTWISVNDLDFTAPVNTGIGQKDGNLAINRTNVSYTISGLSIANGQSFTIRWSDFNVTASDDGLAIDDFSLSFTNVATNVGINSTYAIMNFGGADVYYDLMANTANTDFNNANLGTYNSSQSLYLDGAQNNVYKCSGGDITGGTLYYRIYPVAAAAPSFSSTNIGFSSGGNNGCGGQDQTWETANAGINLLYGRCDGEYFIEVYTSASTNSSTLLANNTGANYKARFTINNAANSGIYESYIILNKNSTGNTYYDLNAATGNPDFVAGLGNFCTNETLLLAGGENKVFKCGSNNIINGTLYYRIYPSASPSGIYSAVNLGTATNIGGAGSGCQNQQWTSTTNTTNILNGLAPGNYTIEVYSQADYNLGLGGTCGSVYASNSGNNYKATFTVLAPVTFTSKPATTVNAQAETGCSAVVNYNFTIAGSATINTTYTFSGVTTANGTGTGTGATFNLGITNVVVSSSNSCGTVTYSFNVVVADNVAPVAIAQNITLALDASGTAALTAAQVNNGSTDNCGIQSMAIDKTSFNCADVQGAPVSDLFISEYVEGSGNNKAIEIYNGTGAAIDLSGYQIKIYANGASSPNSTTALTGMLATGSSFVIANASATASILSIANQTSGNINFNGNDAVVLTKTSGAVVDIFGKIGSDPGSAWVSGASSTLDATLRRKAFVHVGITNNPGGTGASAFTTLGTEWEAYATDNITNLGTHTVNNQIPVVLTVTDNSNNTATATALITVVDNLAPAAPTLSTVTGECNATVTAPTAQDNCAGTITGTTTSPLTYNAQGAYSIVWSFDDGNGNVSTATQAVVVDDITAPVAPTLSAVTGECNATVTAPTAQDNCAGTITGTTTSPLTYNAQGTYSIVWSFDDGNGNVSTATQAVVVDDNTAPAAPILSTVTGECSATVTAPTVQDNCAGTITGTTTDPTSYSQQGTYTVHWSFNDGNGNTSTATQTVVVDDNTNPTIAAMPNITLNACQPTATWTVPTAQDNCSGYTVVQVAGPASGSTFANGTTTTITYRVTDIGGNTATSSFTVTRNASLAAQCSTNNQTLYYGYAGDQSAIVSVNIAGNTGPYTVVATMNRALKCNVVNTSGDELWTATGATSVNNVCPGTGNATLLPQSTFTGVGAGTYSVNVTLMADAVITFTITDANGCVTTCSQTIHSTDVRCFAGNSGNAKITICHQTGSSKNPCIKICVDESALAEHLAHGDYVGACTPTCAPPANNLIASSSEQPEATKLELQVVPNPTPDFFNIYVKSASNEPIVIRVIDMFGRTIMNQNVAANTKVKFGHNLAWGTYFVQAIQGKVKLVQKVIKVN